MEMALDLVIKNGKIVTPQSVHEGDDIAVEKGAKEGESFSEYLSYLGKKGYITPPMEKP
jgi:hypothetical protein